MWFRKKPVAVEAMQYTGENCREILKFMGSAHWDNAELHDTDQPVIHALEGQLTASVDDWIIRGAAGEFYPCKDAIFMATYEPI